MKARLWLALLALSFGCQSKPRLLPDTVRYNLQTEPPSLDWSITTDNASVMVISNIMEGLAKYDQEMRPIPAIAHSWESLEGGKRYVFHLRPEARWSDGKPVTADDFVYSWQRLLKPETAAEYAYFLYLVKNARQINSGEIKDPAQLGVRALDAHTLEVILERPAVFFPVITTFVVTFPERRDLVEKYPDSWTEPEHILTNGPFVPTSWHHEYKLVIEPNPFYYGPKPQLKKVTFYMVNEQTTELTLYETGDLDLDRLPPQAIPAYKSSPEYHNRAELGTYYIGFNIEKPPVDNPLVRRALAMAIDRSKIPEILKGGQIPATSFIPPGMFGHNPEIGCKFDPGKAVELLARAGYPKGKNLPPLTLVFNTQEGNQLICEYVQAQWQKNLGITVYLKNMEWKAYLKELQLDSPQAWRLGWYADYPDPDNFAEIFISDSGNNHTRFKNREYDRLVELALSETDPLKRQELYDQSQRLLLEESCAFIPLYFYAQNWLIKPYVKGLELLPVEMFYFDKIWLEPGAEK